MATVRQNIDHNFKVLLCLKTIPGSLSFLTELVQHIKPTKCLLHVVPAKMLKEAFDMVEPCLHAFIISYLSSASVPAAFKHAVVRNLL